MKIDELIIKVASEPPRTVTLATNVLAPGRLQEAQRKGGMLLTELLSGASRGAPRTACFGHVLGPPASSEAFNAWQEKFPNHRLPRDLMALLARVNGIHLWADLATGRAYSGLAPLEEWDLARIKMYGQEAAPHLLADRYVAISYHTDSAALIVLDVDSGGYFLMDSCGPDETCPIGASTDELLDWVWNYRTAP